MKKMLVGCAALALAATAVTAADVTSSNIVGYQKIQLKEGFNLIGTSWEGVGENSQILLAELFDPSVLVSYDETGLIPGDRINTWDVAAGNWSTTYYYIDQPSWGVDYENRWVDSDILPANPVFDTGDGFWLILQTNVEITVKSQVPTEAQSVTLKSGYNLLANPFPYERDWNSGAITGTGMTSYDETGLIAGDRINTWNIAAGNWSTTYYYIDQPSWGEDYEDTWVDSDILPANLSFGANEGFWYIAIENGVELTINPMTLP